MSIRKKDVTVGFRATHVRKALYQQVAEELEGVRLSEWLRRLADRRVAEMTRGDTGESAS